MAQAHSLIGKRLVLTGAGGFLGRNLLPLLLKEGVSVSAITSRTHFELCQLAGVDAGDEWVHVVSQADRAGISETLADCDFLINAGFPRNTDGRQLAQGMEFIDWLFQEASCGGTRAVVNISSQSVYDQHRTEPASESTPVCPQSPYAVAKYATELMLNNSCKAIPHTNIRLASLIGPGFDQRVVNKMVVNALAEKRILSSDQTGMFGYLDIMDAALAIVRILEIKSVEWPEVVNVGSGDGYTTTDIAKLIRSELMGRGYSVDIVSQETNNSKTNTTVNANLLRVLTGWSPAESLSKTIKRIVDANQIDGN